MFRYIIAVFFLLSLSSCGLMHKPNAGEAPKAMKHTSQSGAPVNAVAPVVETVAEFDDIPIPSELSRDNERSFIYEAPGVTMGVIGYSGYYKGGSIAKFFRAEMPKHDWQFLNGFSEGDKYLISFIKADKSCLINIEEGSLSTRITIKIGPTQGR